jgi:hypothetical protein
MGGDHIVAALTDKAFDERLARLGEAGVVQLLDVRQRRGVHGFTVRHLSP